jgi:hypothetical protein
MKPMQSEYYYDVAEDVIWDVRNDQPYNTRPTDAQDLADIPYIKGWRRALLRDGQIAMMDERGVYDVNRARDEGLTLALISF